MPGTDAALALGMMHVIVAEGLHDERYLDRCTRWASSDSWSGCRITRPSTSPTITGIDADQIRDLARAYANTRPAAIRLLVGMEHHAYGASAYRAISLSARRGRRLARPRRRLCCHMTFQLFGDIDWSCGISVPEDRAVRAVNMVQVGRALD